MQEHAWPKNTVIATTYQRISKITVITFKIDVTRPFSIENWKCLTYKFCLSHFATCSMFKFHKSISSNTGHPSYLSLSVGSTILMLSRESRPKHTLISSVLLMFSLPNTLFTPSKRISNPFTIAKLSSSSRSLDRHRNTFRLSNGYQISCV